MGRKIKRIVIGGGSGFIGTALSAKLRARGDEVIVISRTPGTGRITWDDLCHRSLPPCDTVINLAGKHILDMRRRWTAAYRQEVIDSRMNTTSLLVKKINESKTPPKTFISTSGKCFYGARSLPAGTEYPSLDEGSSPMTNDFPSTLVAKWEQAAAKVDTRRTRHVQIRIAIVLAMPQKSGSHSLKQFLPDFSRGILPLLCLPFRLGLGGIFGSGRQPFPWIHIDDLIDFITRCIDDAALSGTFNAVSPGIVSNEEFSKKLAQRLNRRCAIRYSQRLIETIVGHERSSILLAGQMIKPTRTLETGFHFKFGSIESALENLIAPTLEHAKKQQQPQAMRAINSFFRLSSYK